MHGNIALIQVGNKLATQTRRHHQRSQHYQHRHGHHRMTHGNSLVQQRLVAVSQPRHGARFLFLYSIAKQQCNTGGHKGNRQQHGATQRDDHR